MWGSSSPWHDPGWVISCWARTILERTGYASCPSWYFIHRRCKQDHREGQTKGSLLCCPLSGGDTVQEQELPPCTSSQPGLLEATQLTYTMSTLALETFGTSQEKNISTGWWGSQGHAKSQLPPSHLACSNSPTKTKTQRSQKIYSKQEQAWGWRPQHPVPGLSLLSREVVSHQAQALTERSPRLRHAKRLFPVQLGRWVITHKLTSSLHHGISAGACASCTKAIGFPSL